MAKLFFLLSGEHESLPTSELKAIFQAENCQYKVLEKLDQVLRLESSLDCIRLLKYRAAFTRLCGQELFNCQADVESIKKATCSTNFEEVLQQTESFAVRIKHVRNYSSKIDGMLLEKELGEIILKQTGARVNLKSPDKTFTGILTDEKLVFGMKLAEIPAKPFVERRPRKKPFFHPSAMTAKLARCMVNLAKPRKGELLLDPFCGTGTMLIEASLIGCQVVGLDIQRRMIKGTNLNLVHFKTKSEGLIVADAKSVPLCKIDCVVTDPPYGISSTTLKRTTKQIIEELLVAVHELLSKGQRICMAAPKTLRLEQLGTALGYKYLESHFFYVHRSLTREIVVFEKV